MTGTAVIEMGNADLVGAGTWVPTRVDQGVAPMPGHEHAANLPPPPRAAAEIPDELNVAIAPPIAPGAAA